MKRPHSYGSMKARIQANIAESTRGCWVWKLKLDDDGYGRMNVYSSGELRRVRTVRAMRASYEAFVGPIPEGLVLDHLCRNRACVNPDHLEPVSPAENARRKPEPMTRCMKHGAVKLASGCVKCRRESWRKCARRIRAMKREAA